MDVLPLALKRKDPDFPKLLEIRTRKNFAQFYTTKSGLHPMGDTRGLHAGEGPVQGQDHQPGKKGGLNQSSPPRHSNKTRRTSRTLATSMAS
jgi:hypothetical protein